MSFHRAHRASGSGSPIRTSIAGQWHIRRYVIHVLLLLMKRRWPSPIQQPPLSSPTQPVIDGTSLLRCLFMWHDHMIVNQQVRLFERYQLGSMRWWMEPEDEKRLFDRRHRQHQQLNKGRLWRMMDACVHWINGKTSPQQQQRVHSIQGRNVNKMDYYYYYSV